MNTQLYINMLAENVLPWITESFGNSYVFTQDGASSQHIEFDAAVVQRSFQRVLGQKHVASLKSRHQPNHQWTLISGISQRMMSVLNPTQVWLL